MSWQRLAIGGLALSVVGGCPRIPAGPDAPAHAPASTTPRRDRPPPLRFSGAAALDRVKALMAWPRGLGDPRREASIDALAQMLETAGAEVVERQPLTAADPATGDPYALVNLIAHLRPQASRRFVLATHFDTRPWADEEEDPQAHRHPVPGANDGTSGVAVVLELMPTLAEALPPQVGLTVILFDGEELGRPGHGGYCMGSRHFAQQAALDPPAWLPGAQLGIVLDMVGDRELTLPIEPGSQQRAPALVEHLWATARRRGHAQFVDQHRPIAVIDDHVYLAEAGIPSALIIDRDYEAWHTRRDTIELVSAQSLAAVGDTVLHTMMELAAVPAD